MRSKVNFSWLDFREAEAAINAEFPSIQGLKVASDV
jgi:hypothetical protein